MSKTLLIAHVFGAVSETFIMRHAEILKESAQLSTILVTDNALKTHWDDIVVYGISKPRLRPLYDYTIEHGALCFVDLVSSFRHIIHWKRL